MLIESDWRREPEASRRDTTELRRRLLKDGKGLPSVMKAMRFAEEAHRGQCRADGKTPYIQHPIAVAELVGLWLEGHSDCEVVVTAALLHDVLEDTPTQPGKLLVEFPGCFSLVEWMTCTGRGQGKKEEQIRKMREAPKHYALLKVADRACNCRDLPSSNWHPKRQLDYMMESLELVAQAAAGQLPDALTYFMAGVRG